MTVADLQQHLADLARLLAAGGAKGVAGDLEAIQLGLAPFRDLALKGFADFLTRAEAYSRGEVPLQGGRRPTGGARRAATAAQPAEEFAALEREVLDLFDRAAEPAVTKEQVEALGPRLARLKKPDLLKVCEGVGLFGQGSKSKDKLVGAVKERILARKGATQRASIIDRDPTAPMTAPGEPGRRD